MNRKLKSNLLILLAAFIWGTAFLAQKEGGEIGTFTFNGLRFFIGGTFLLPVISVLDSKRTKQENAIRSTAETICNNSKDSITMANSRISVVDTYDRSSDMVGRAENVQDAPDMGWNKTVFIGGIICGIILFIASSLQQYGIAFTTLGKAGFITALYSVLVPVFSILIGKRVAKLTWVGVVLGVTGLYFLSLYGEHLSISKGDAFMLACAFGFMFQIMMIDHFSPRVDGVKLSCVQFFTIGFVSLFFMFKFEDPNLSTILSAWPSLLYAGIFSSGIAYTLQVVGQKYAEPTQAALIMCLESVFSMLTGAIVLGERMTSVEYMGAAMIFTAVVLSQLPDGNIPDNHMN